MKLLMNYIYQYENNLEIILKQDWFMPDLITSITCKRKGNYLKNTFLFFKICYN